MTMARPNRSVVVLLSILTVILVGWVLHVGAAIIQPLVIALLLTVMLQPLVVRMARLHIPPWLTVLALIAGLFVGLVQVSLVLQANVAQILGETAAADPELIDPVLETQEELSSGFDWPKLVDGLEVRLQESAMPQEVQDLFIESMRELDLAGVVRGVIDGGLGFTSSLLLIMIYMMFIFAESKIFKRKILSLSEDRKETQNILENIGKGIQRYLGVKTAVSLMTGSLCYFVLVRLQIPYALLFGLLTFLLNYIPTFGSIIAAIFPTVTALAVEASWSKAVMVIFCYLSVNIILGSVLEPRILGRELNLSPLVIIISVVVWAGLWGVVGAFLAVPITSAIQIVMLNSPRLRPVAILLSIGPPKERDDGGGDGAAPAPSAA